MTFAIQAAAAFLLTLLLTPVCRAVCLRFAWVDWPDDRKLHRSPTPRAGGVAIFAGYAAAACLHHAWTILPAVSVAFATGLLDDAVNIKPRTKIAGQILAALLLCASGVRILGGTAWWHIPITVVWLVGCTNAVNLIDGLDGLAAGAGCLAAAAAFVTALLTGNATLAAASAPLLGALPAFLCFNFSPASIFMGDSGSNTIGFLLGAFTILWTKNTGAPAALVAPVMALALPILDTTLAIFRRFVRRDAIFAADRGHIHHRLLARGFTTRRAALILYGAAAVFAMLSILPATGAYSAGPVLVAFVIVVWLALRYLRYDEFDAVRRVLLGGTLREALAADLAVRELEAAIRAADSIDGCWCAIEDRAATFGIASITMRTFGRTFTAQFESPEDDCCALTVPLDGAGSIELAMSAIPAALIRPLRATLARKLVTLRPRLALAARR